MPYFKLKDRFVFLHNKNYSKLNEIALKDKDEDWIRFSYYEKTVESKEAFKLREKTINEIFKSTDFEKFYREWVYFKLEGSEAIDDLPYLLFDYSCLNKHIHFQRTYIDLKTGMPFDLLDSNIIEPIYEISICNSSVFKAEADVLFSTLLDTRKIKCIEGELNNFSIEMDDYFLLFDKAVHISPKL
jgi:hypothetical protein